MFNSFPSTVLNGTIYHVVGIRSLLICKFADCIPDLPREEENCVCFWEVVISGYSFAFNRIFLGRQGGSLKLDVHGTREYFRFSLWIKVENAYIVNQGVDSRDTVEKFSV